MSFALQATGTGDAGPSPNEEKGRGGCVSPSGTRSPIRGRPESCAARAGQRAGDANSAFEKTTTGDRWLRATRVSSSPTEPESCDTSDCLVIDHVTWMSPKLFGTFFFRGSPILTLPPSPRIPKACRLPESRGAGQHGGPGVLGGKHRAGRAPPPAASWSCGENLESAAPGPEHCACPVAPPGAGRPQICSSSRRGTLHPDGARAAGTAAFRGTGPCGPARPRRRDLGRPGRATCRVRSWGGGGTGNGRGGVTRDCPPRSGAAIFSPARPRARDGGGSGETQPGRLPTRPGPPPSPASARLPRGVRPRPPSITERTLRLRSQNQKAENWRAALQELSASAFPQGRKLGRGVPVLKAPASLLLLLPWSDPFPAAEDGGGGRCQDSCRSPPCFSPAAAGQRGWCWS